MSMCTFPAPGLHTQFSQKAIADHDLAFDTARPEAGGTNTDIWLPDRNGGKERESESPFID